MRKAYGKVPRNSYCGIKFRHNYFSLYVFFHSFALRNGMKSVADLVTCGNYLVAHIFTEHSNMCLTVVQTKPALKPFVCLLFRHNPVLPYFSQRSMCKDSSVTKLAVGESSHRSFAISMSVHIRIALGITVTDKQICGFIYGIFLVDHTCGTELGFSAAIWAIDFLLLFHLVLTCQVNSAL